MSRGSDFHLAQANVALAVDRFDSPAMAGMMARMAEINALAEASPGFVWRFRNPPGSDWLAPFADYFGPFEPERIFFNMSVWRSVEELRRYVFETEHAGLWRKRENWMLAPVRPNLTMWWLPRERFPAVEEARRKLASIEDLGLTQEAFSFARSFPPPDKTVSSIRAGIGCEL